ncbi:MAG: response regulator [Chitinispirillaceae bacterium]|nr:response regulator [Chitinispirillaceae bacterium]
MSAARKILVVDDSNDNREAVRDLLRFLKFEVRDACNGNEALQIAGDFKPDLYIIDIMMPGMSGLELLEKIDVASHPCEAIMMTGHENINDACRAIDLGALSYLRKPVRHDELSQHIEKAIGRIEERESEESLRVKLEHEVKHQTGKVKEAIQIAELQSKRFDLILQNMQEPLIAIDNNRIIVMINPAAEQAFHIKSGKALDQLIGTVLPDLIPSTLLEHITDWTQDAHPESTVYTITRNHRYYAMSASPLIQANDRMTGYVFIFTDTTTSVQSAQLRNSFLSVVSHEFKSPLLVLMNSASILGMKQHCSEEIAQVKSLIDETCGKLSRLMNTVATFARISPDDVKLHCKSVHLRTFLEKSAEKKQGNAGEKSISIIILGEDVFPAIETDADLLETAVACLLDNAIKYSPMYSEVRIGFSLPTSMQPEQLVVTIEDDGPGFDNDKQQLLFEWFKQGEDPLTRHHSGLGLGLPLARRAVSLLGGKIGIESREGGGCTVTMTLPVQPPSRLKHLP